MENFWGTEVWGTMNLGMVLLASLLAGNILKKSIRVLQASLIPTSVIGGTLLIIVAAIYKGCTGNIMFDTPFFGGDGTAALEVITYHSLALGFIASVFKTNKGKVTKKRAEEIFNTGVTTVSTYLLQGIFGIIISIIAAKVLSGFFAAAGVLLPFGYGQGTGQALNYGTIYENDFGFVGGKSFGLTVAALGFISAALGGVAHLNILRRRGKINIRKPAEGVLHADQIQTENEIPMQESMDKMTVQLALVAVSYLLTYFLMKLMGTLLPGMKSVVYGFNFLLGVLMATLVKVLIALFKKKGLIKKDYINSFLMTRTSNFFFDLMVVAGVAAIRLGILERYWGVLMIMAVVGTAITYVYNRYVANRLFPEYPEEQFLMMYGMLTGTASTGIILLREIDGDFITPASDNMVYQNFPAIVFGFPLMLLATLAPRHPMLTLGIFIGFFALMNVILFRAKIFKRKK